MLYRVRINLAFENESDANAIFSVAEGMLHKAKRIALADELADTTFIEVHECFHDERPVKPCKVIKRKEV